MIAGHKSYLICIYVALIIQEIPTTRPYITFNGFTSNINPVLGREYSDYEENYWIGDIPQDYIDVKEKTIQRKEFEPSKFKLTGRKQRKNDTQEVVNIRQINCLISPNSRLRPQYNIFMS